MAKVKRYQSKSWLERRRYKDKATIDEIAKECGTSHMTIRRAMDKFGVK